MFIFNLWNISFPEFNLLFYFYVDLLQMCLWVFNYNLEFNRWQVIVEPMMMMTILTLSGTMNGRLCLSETFWAA